MTFDDLIVPNKALCGASALTLIATAPAFEVAQENGLGECADRCREVLSMASLCARLAATNSRLLADVARSFGAACERCADECEQYDAPALNQCAAACRDAAKACRRLLA